MQMRTTVSTANGFVSLDQLSDEERQMVADGIEAAWLQVWRGLSASLRSKSAIPTSGRSFDDEWRSDSSVIDTEG